MAINKHQITGRVGKKPELRFTPSGKEVTSFSLIHQPRRLNQQTQQWEDGEATWYDVTVFGRQANNVAESIDKGFEVSVIGTLKVGSYVTRDTKETKTTLEILADEVYIPLDHQIVSMVDKSAYGNKVSGGTGAPSNGGYSNYGGGQRGGGNFGGGFGGASEEDAPF